MSKRAAEVGRKTPPEYELAGHWHFTGLGRWSLVAILAGGTCIFVLTLILGVVARGMLQGSVDFHVSSFLVFLIFVGIVAATMILHEAIHGLVFLFLGGKPHFGAKLLGGFFPVVYASAAGPFVSRNHYLLVGLAPFLVLTPLFLLMGILVCDDGVALIALTAMAMNIAGSTGDLQVAWKVRQLGGGTLFEDTSDGFNWYRPSMPNL